MTSTHADPNRPKLLDELADAARQKGHPAATAAAMVSWCRRFILFHGKRHPQEMGPMEIGRFLANVARNETGALVAIEVAREAIGFLYREVLHRDVGELPRPRPPRLLDQVRQVLRVKHYAKRTEECYVQWIRRFILFHGKRHPREMGAAEVSQFLTDLAVQGRVSASTQNQALNAMAFLFKQVLEIELGKLEAVRARRGKRLPVVMSAEEVRRVLLFGDNWLSPLATIRFPHRRSMPSTAGWRRSGVSRSAA